MMKFQSQPASALLIAFVMMSLLIGVSLGVNYLVVQDVSAVRSLVSGTQAEYAAEGLNEYGLAQVTAGLPGYEPDLTGQMLRTGTVGDLNVTARGTQVPCSIAGQEWRELNLNESLQLPLFAQLDSDGTVEPLNDFFLEFYIEAPNGQPVRVTGDVLRWKILGMRPEYNDTEAISEFIALDLGNERFTDVTPSIFGPSVPSDRSVPTGYTHAKYFQREPFYSYFESYPIADFLTNHSYNYLILTNVANALGDGYKMMVRMNSEGSMPVCEYVHLESTADQFEYRQSMETIIREGENLPVFDFVLYHTE